jgi:hypothetical protein
LGSSPLYKEQLNLIFDKKHVVTWKKFVEKYGLRNEGLNSKHLKLGKYIEDVEVKRLFKSFINKNNYRYFWLEDEKLIANMENL